MNRFILADTPEDIAKYLCDKHVVKMPLEEAQMLSSVVRRCNPEYADAHGLYRLAHANHPCTLWAGRTRANYSFALSLLEAMLSEYTHRYGKVHASQRLCAALSGAISFIPEGDLTKHPECFGTRSELVSDDAWPVDSYRAYYHTKQSNFLMWWTKRGKPEWFTRTFEE